MNFRKQIRSAVLVLSGLALVCCSSIEPLFGPEFQGFFPFSYEQGYRQAPQYAYAGEVLSYMMQVVLGRAGDLSMRNAWREKGLDVELTLATVKDLLQNPGTDKQAVMVMDANVLALSKVLYSYDPRLNQFKGMVPFNSPYPSAELMALRLLLLKKMDKGEKLPLGRIMARDELISNPGNTPSAEDCGAMNLTPKEVRLLQDVFFSEPHLKAYLKNPFLLAALYRMGILEMDYQVERALETANYRACAVGRPKKRGVEIVLLPSFISGFRFGEDLKGETRYGFSADSEYLAVVAAFRKRLEAAIVKSAREKQHKLSLAAPDAILDHVTFCHLSERPLAVYPENAEDVIAAVCPHADIAVIFLGNDVYRSFLEGAETLGRLEGGRIFLDILDVKYKMVEEEIARTADAVLIRLAKFF